MAKVKTQAAKNAAMKATAEARRVAKRRVRWQSRLRDFIADHWVKYLNFALRCANNNTQDVSDCVANAYIAFCRHPEYADRTDAELRAMFYRAIQNELNGIRRQQKRRRIESNDPSAIGSSRNIAESADHANALEKTNPLLWDCLQQLPQHVRMIAEMRFLDELPSREIARVLQLPIKSVYKATKQAKELLRQCYEAHPNPVRS